MRDPLLNQHIKQYYLQERLQSGGMAVVYKAYDQQRRELVAFKVLRENFTNQPQTVLRFRREAEIAQQLVHPHIVPFYDFGAVVHGHALYGGRQPGGSLESGRQRESRAVGALVAASCQRVRFCP